MKQEHSVLMKQEHSVLMKQEQLGTTGVGNGIAIPHGKLPNLDRLYGIFARLEHPIDFESIDHRPVDLIFLLIAPGSSSADCLKALARVSRLLRDKAMCEKLRGIDDAEALYALLVDAATSGVGERLLNSGPAQRPTYESSTSLWCEMKRLVGL
jgi:mannitol/fructose-specific phosphotransferase system IIA component (Ntr-type)